MGGVAYVVSVGTTPEAVVSCVWAYADERGPPRVVHLVCSRETEGLAPELERELRVVCGPDLEVGVTVVDAEDVLGSAEAVRSVVESLKRAGMRVVVDVTPGRKTMSIALFKAAVEGGADEVRYLLLRDRSYEGCYYPEIPRPLVEGVRVWG